ACPWGDSQARAYSAWFSAACSSAWEPAEKKSIRRQRPREFPNTIPTRYSAPSARRVGVSQPSTNTQEWWPDLRFCGVGIRTNRCVGSNTSALFQQFAGGPDG